MNELANKAIAALFYQYGGLILKIFFQTLLIIILARRISPDQFGLMAMATVVISFASLFNQMGLGPAIIFKRDISCAHINTAFTVSCLLGFFFFFVCFAISSMIGDFYNNSEVSLILRVLSVGFIISSLSVVSKSVLMKNLEFRKLFIVDIVSLIIGSFSIGIVLALLNYGVWALVFSTLSQMLFSSIISLYYYPPELGFFLDKQAANEIFSYGLGLTYSQIFNFIGQNADRIIFGKLLGDVQLGYYEIPFQLRTQFVTYLGGIPDTVLFPTLSRFQNNVSTMGNIMNIALEIGNTIAIPISIYIIIFANEIVPTIFGNNWIGSVVPLALAFTVAPLKFSVKIFDSVVRAEGSVYASAKIKVFFALILIFLVTILSYLYGLEGGIVGTIIASIFVFILMMHLCCDITNTSVTKLIRGFFPGSIIGIVIIIVGIFAKMQFQDSLNSVELLIISSILIVVPTYIVLRYYHKFIFRKDTITIMSHIAQKIIPLRYRLLPL